MTLATVTKKGIHAMERVCPNPFSGNKKDCHIQVNYESVHDF